MEGRVMAHNEYKKQVIVLEEKIRLKKEVSSFKLLFILYICIALIPCFSSFKLK